MTDADKGAVVYQVGGNFCRDFVWRCGHCFRKHRAGPDWRRGPNPGDDLPCPCGEITRCLAIHLPRSGVTP